MSSKFGEEQAKKIHTRGEGPHARVGGRPIVKSEPTHLFHLSMICETLSRWRMATPTYHRGWPTLPMIGWPFTSLHRPCIEPCKEAQSLNHTLPTTLLTFANKIRHAKYTLEWEIFHNVYRRNNHPKLAISFFFKINFKTNTIMSLSVCSCTI